MIGHQMTIDTRKIIFRRYTAEMLRLPLDKDKYTEYDAVTALTLVTV